MLSDRDFASWKLLPGGEEAFDLQGRQSDKSGSTWLTREEIDQLEKLPGLDTIRISGLRQDTFEYFISRYGRQMKRIFFWKCHLVEDWTMLSSLPQAEYIYWFWNQRITRLWDLSANPHLVGLRLYDFTRLRSIAEIQGSTSLRQLAVGNAIWARWEIDSLLPLAGMPLTYLAFEGKKILDNDLSFLPALRQLRRFDCALNIFTTEQFAWIAANCPQADGRGWHAVEDWGEGDQKKACILGKRKPILSYRQHGERIRKYEQAYEQLKEKYRGVPYHTAFPDG